MNNALPQNTSIKYVIVEISLERSNVRNIEKGLFRGLRTVQDNPTYIWLCSEKKVMKMCSLTEYTIVSVESYDGEARTMVFFMSDEDEQIEAGALLVALKNNLEHLCSKKDPEIIDTDKYKNVPKDFGGPGIIKVSLGRRSDITNYSQQRSAAFQTGDNGLYSTTSYVREPEPALFKRETRKPSKAILEKLKAKLDLIAKGEYECELPIIKADEEEKKLPVGTSATCAPDDEPDEYCEGYFG